MARLLTISGFALALFLAAPASAQDDAPAPMMGPGMMMQGGHMMGPMGMMAHPDGYVAFLKAELAITAAQEGAFDRFAKALKDSLAKHQARHSRMWQGRMHQGGMRQGMGPQMMGQQARQQSLPETLDSQVKWAEERVESLKALRKAAKPLYDSLSAEQKAKADQLLGCFMCMG